MGLRLSKRKSCGSKTSKNNYISTDDISSPQKFIIKIQLTKMEPGEEIISTNNNNNLNNKRSSAPSPAVLNLAIDENKLNNLNTKSCRTAGSSNKKNNNFVNNFKKQDSNSNITAMAEENSNCHGEVSAAICVQNGGDKSHNCCRRKKSSAYPSKWRCCKCACRHAVKKIIDRKSTCSNPPDEVPSSNHPSVDIITASSSGSEIILPITTRDGVAPQIVVLQYPNLPKSLAEIASDVENGVDPLVHELESSLTLNQRNCNWRQLGCVPITMMQQNNQNPIVHSQVDYIHCLVPDLEKITSSSFYWGKMDRYEAERLLEGKPEGTFLLRDSAQEEYLFSVTFRKYGRSLHARIEQFNHKFSFDCHDPGVFTASTVTGLLEHYKDPSGVMFFEPMLTIPLNRKITFSLQQLCRATIVSHTTYDGINELELPTSLKSYLKDYHYKMRVRVKPLDEVPVYSA